MNPHDNDPLHVTINGYIIGQTINVNGGWYMSLDAVSPYQRDNSSLMRGPCPEIKDLMLGVRSKFSMESRELDLYLDMIQTNSTA